MVKKISQILLQAVRQHGYSDAKACAKDLGFHYELFRKVVGEDHIPRDEQLVVYADKLGLDKAQLVRLAHFWRAPESVRVFLKDLLEPADKKLELTVEDLPSEEKVYIKELLDILRGGDTNVKEGMRSSINSFHKMVKRP